MAKKRAPGIPLPPPDPREPDEYDIPPQGLTPEEFARVYRREPSTDTDMLALAREMETVGGGRHRLFTGAPKGGEERYSPIEQQQFFLDKLLSQMGERHGLGAARTIDDPYSDLPASPDIEPAMREEIQRKYQPPGGYNPELPPQEFIASLMQQRRTV
jgi:hypothetical protein